MKSLYIRLLNLPYVVVQFTPHKTKLENNKRWGSCLFQKRDPGCKDEWETYGNHLKVEKD